MREIKNIMVSVPTVVNLICNSCGCEQIYDDVMGGHEIHSFDIEFGYNSHADGRVLKFDLCSACIQKITDSFKLPVEAVADLNSENLGDSKIPQDMNEHNKRFGVVEEDKVESDFPVYVVFRGRSPGIYREWAECKAQINEYSGAKYKKFESEKLGKDAMEKFIADNSVAFPEKGKVNGTFLRPMEGISVDGAFSSSTFFGEYQCVDIATSVKLFGSKKYRGGSNNIMEFIGLVEAIKYIVDKKLKVDIYSDSQTAIGWVEKGRATTTIKKTKESEELFKKLEDSERYLLSLKFLPKIKKWETAKWGEIPADFGNK